MWEQLELRSTDRVLIYGIGNVGRQDDGLGVRLIEKLETLAWPERVTLEANYQLNIEDALLISDFDVVLFADASVETGHRSLYSVRPVQPSPSVAFSTHAMGIGEVAFLCEALYQRKPRVFLLTLSGSLWGISEGLSEAGERALQEAYEFIASRFRLLYAANV